MGATFLQLVEKEDIPVGNTSFLLQRYLLPVRVGIHTYEMSDKIYLSNFIKNIGFSFLSWRTFPTFSTARAEQSGARNLKRRHIKHELST
jgi:hypothetical protein